MNQYQRIGTLLVRIVGGITLLLGVFGEAYAGAVAVGLMPTDYSRPPSFVGSALWILGGTVLLSSALRVGRWLGRGLD